MLHLLAFGCKKLGDRCNYDETAMYLWAVEIVTEAAEAL